MRNEIGFIAIGQAAGNIGLLLEEKGYNVLFIWFIAWVSPDVPLFIVMMCFVIWIVAGFTCMLCNASTTSNVDSLNSMNLFGGNSNDDAFN